MKCPAICPACLLDNAVMSSHRIFCWGISLTEISDLEFKLLSLACSREEHDRAGRFVFEQDRNSYLAAHGLLRFALTDCQPGYGPEDWYFTKTKYGKPVLSPEYHPRLKFNLSHCRSRVVCVVTHDLECGIDVEASGRTTNIDQLSHNCLAKSEINWLLCMPEIDRTAYFLRFWTLKEAISKAWGLGLNLPFCELELDITNKPMVMSVPEGMDSKLWLHQVHSEGGHIEAVALKLETEDVIVSLIRKEFKLCGSL